MQTEFRPQVASAEFAMSQQSKQRPLFEIELGITRAYDA
jgi:hypothetical protein